MPTYSKIKSAVKLERNGRARTIAVLSFLSIIALTAVITVTILALTDNEDRPNQEVSTAIVFGLPVAEFTSILKNSSLTELQYNETMRRWEAHKTVSLEAPLGTHVIATFAGTVTSVRDHTMYGRMVTIQHRDGLQTVYSNLDRNTVVSEGQRVEKGQRIGSVGQTGAVEFIDTPHLRVAVYRDGRRVDPNDFIDFPAK